MSVKNSVDFFPKHYILKCPESNLYPIIWSPPGLWLQLTTVSEEVWWLVFSVSLGTYATDTDVGKWGTWNSKITMLVTTLWKNLCTLLSSDDILQLPTLQWKKLLANLKSTFLLLLCVCVFSFCLFFCFVFYFPVCLYLFYRSANTMLQIAGCSSLLRFTHFAEWLVQVCIHL